MNVLLSIKPEFASKIFDGTKRYEFRRLIFKNKSVRKVIVYASTPTQMVIGEFEIGKIIHEDINTLWEKTKRYAGISEELFFGYFTNKSVGYAIEVKNTILYDEPICLKKHFKVSPPQSFLYL